MYTKIWGILQEYGEDFLRVSDCEELAVVNIPLLRDLDGSESSFTAWIGVSLPDY